MIPLHLSLSGFLSYRERAELDFTTFELACIAGANGAGKSTLLDAITWALFGQARKRDESLINSQANAAEVALTFAYEGNIYRVQRSLPRGKTSMLEFSIFQADQEKEKQEIAAQTDARSQDTTTVPSQKNKSDDSEANPPGRWKPLTERTLRETQERIEKTLRMNYETFVNASFFLQGKADQFTQQRPGDRKRILGSILGLEIWETYRQGAAERRKSLEADISALDGRLEEINAELAEEAARKSRLKELHLGLERLSKLRTAQEAMVENMRRSLATLEEQRKLVKEFLRQLESATRNLSEQETRLAERQAEKESYKQIIAREKEILAAYKGWQQARADIEYWDEIAARFRDHEKRRQGPLDEINAARARLLQEQQSLTDQEKRLDAQVSERKALDAQIAATRLSIEQAEQGRAQSAAIQEQLQTALQKQADQRAENPRLKAEMDELKGRIEQLEVAEGAICPLCGQPLSQEDRQRLIDELMSQGKEMGDRYRANQAELRESDQLVRGFQTQISGLASVESELLVHSQRQAQLTAHLEQFDQQQAGWEQEGALRLVEVNRLLEGGSFAPEAQERLIQIDTELKAIGYDAAAHDAARRAELIGRSAEAAQRELEKAGATLAPLEREIANLETQIERLKSEVRHQEGEYGSAATNLAAAEAAAPDLDSAERELLNLREQENRLGQEVGAAQQRVDVLSDLKKRRKTWEERREELARLVSQLKQLERAFGKDGVPALLIEQALPQIEAKANDILDRLSGGNMAVRFITQAAYKDRHREDLRETLDIQISDSAGTRDYEMFSGGEAFRVNFAIRLALSEVLAQRAGARLQTLVIDEGFGSQDALGRQRLIEAINLVRQDFAKILVITHIEELKEAFPTRIEVEKTGEGSRINVV